MARKSVDVAVILPDASPIMTLDRIGRLDLLDFFAAPIKIVDQVHFEVTKTQNDPRGAIAAWFVRKGNAVQIVETMTGLGYQALLARGAKPPADAGETAVDEFAMRLARTTGPGFVPLVLFEDPDVLDLRIARMKTVHMVNTVGWLRSLESNGLLPDAPAIIEAINALRKTPMIAFDRPAQTKKVRSRYSRKPEA